MPAPKHLAMTWSGIFGTTTSPVEIWSMSLSAGFNNNFVSRPSLTPLAEALRTAWGTHLAPGIFNGATLTRTRVASVGDDGQYERDDGGAYVLADDETAVPGAASGSQYLQVALAISLESDFNGPTGRGRFYVPTPSLGTITDGLFATAQQTNWVNRAKAFVDAVNAALAAHAQPLGRVSVASGGSAARGLPPALHPVTRVAVGRRPDIQRRRANDIDEQKARAALA